MSLRRNAILKETGVRIYDKRAIETKAYHMEIMSRFERHNYVSKRLLKKKYDNKCVITKVNIDKNGKVKKIFYGTTSHSPLVTMTNPDRNFVRKVAVANKNNDITYNVNIDGTRGEYVYYPEVIQVEYKNNQGQLEMSRKGCWIKAGERVRFTKPVTNIDEWLHLPGASVWGPSNEKAGNKFFFANTRSNEEWWTEVDNLTGFAFEFYFSSPQKPEKILKNASRLNLFGTTMEKFGQIDLRQYHIVVANCSFDAVEDTDEDTKERLGKAGIKFGKNINDGKNYLLADLLADWLRITPEESCFYAVQNRENYLQTKCLGQNFLADQMAMIEENVKALYGNSVVTYGNTDGPCALIVDIDGAKLINEEALKRGDVIIDCYGLAIAKASGSRTSGQLIAKMLEKDYEAAIKRLQELMIETFDNAVNDKLLNSKFNPKLGLSNNTAAVLGELAANDEGYMWSLLHDLTNFTKSALADMKINLNSVYNHAMFDDCYVQSRGMVDHILKTIDCGKYGLLVETYSPDILAYFGEEIHDIEENDALTDAEKKELLDDLLSAVIIKYPSAGAEEYLGVRYLTQKEWWNRVSVALKEITDERVAEHFKQYCNQIPFGVTLFPSFNFVKNKLAGMDVDYDATLAIFDKIKSILINKESKNILTFIDYDDSSEMDYSEITTEMKVANLNFSK